MGIDERLIARDVDAATVLWNRITERQWAPSAEGAAMTKALIDAMEHQTPGTVFDGFAGYMVRFLCGDEVADMLDVPRRSWTSLLGGPLRLFSAGSDHVTDSVPLVGSIAGHFSNRFLEGFTWVTRGGERAPFDIPSELAERWQLRTPADVL